MRYSQLGIGMDSPVHCRNMSLNLVQIYPIDVVKTVYQKHQLAAGPTKVSRPDIKFFHLGSYRGLSRNLYPGIMN